MEVVTKPSYVKLNIKVSIPDKHIVDMLIFNELSKELNEAKSLLDIYDGNKIYFLFSRNIFPYNGLKYLLEKRYHIKPITNAWLKTYELLYTIKEFLPKVGEYKIFFNANAPGASTLAAQYFFKQQTELNFDWIASSYMDGTTTLDDTYGLIKNNKEKWLMNSENNGDVRSVSNLEDYERRVGKIDLYFSDVAINIGNNYSNEELLEIHEVFGQNVTGLCTLSVDGIMIVKQRSFLLPFNIWMISYMSQLFIKFDIHKPTTSRSYNSEVYLIGIGFKGISNQEKDFLKAKLHNFGIVNVNSVMTTIDEKVLYNIYKAAANLVQRQKEAIISCVDLYQKHHNKLTNFYDSITVDMGLTRMEFIRNHNIKKVNNTIS